MVRAAVATVVIVVGLLAAGSAAARANAAPASPARSEAPILGEFEDILRALGVLAHSSVTIAATRNLDETASLLATGSFKQIQTALKELWTSDEFYEKAIAGGVCSGMYYVYTNPNDTYTWGSWHSFLIKWARQYAEKHALPFSVQRARSAVNALMRSWDIASVSPDVGSIRNAYLYWRACH